MQLSGDTSGVRVRQSPFGGGAAVAAPVTTSDEDFFSGWDTPAPAPSAPAPRQPMAVSAPMSGPGVMPPGAQLPGVLPPGAQQHQGTVPVAPPGMGPGIQPPAMGQQPMFPQQQQQMPPAPQMPQMGSMMAAVGMAAAAASAGGGVAPGMQEQLFNQVANQGIQYLKPGIAGWFPYLFASLQAQFNVGHGFVLRKLLLLLCPFVQREQGAPAPSYSYGGGDDSPGHAPSGSLDHLKANVNEPDLYIPLMSYFTYCLVYCVQRGILSDFKPEVLGSTFSFAMGLFVLEIVVAKMGFFIAGSQVPVLQLMGNCGYKFVHVLLMVLIRIAIGSSYLYYPFFLYLAACAGFALRRFMSRLEPSEIQQQYGVQPNALHMHIILALAIAQIPLCWLLTPSSAGQKHSAA